MCEELVDYGSSGVSNMLDILSSDNVGGAKHYMVS